jgi:uncharacterized membrane protein
MVLQFREVRLENFYLQAIREVQNIVWQGALNPNRNSENDESPVINLFAGYLLRDFACRRTLIEGISTCTTESSTLFWSVAVWTHHGIRC